MSKCVQALINFTCNKLKSTFEGNYWLKAEKSFYVTHVSPNTLLLLLVNMIWRFTKVKTHVPRNTTARP
jgi:hypothetical protein